MSSNIEAWFTEHENEIIDLAIDIFNHPERPHEEQYSSKCLAKYLEDQGFDLKYGISGQETAFEARFGQGSPCIGFLAEFDALANLGQEPVPYRAPLGNTGHGCGHNLLGAAVIAAACAVKEELRAQTLSGTIIVYGCPAEETLSGKIIMNKAHIFDQLDIAVSWHPFDRNRISYDIWLAHDIKNFKFSGRASHAAKFPELGRSALDAAELMNVGVNYLREHVTDDVRMHYAYTKADAPANIVPDYVETNYFIRSGKRSTTEDVSMRIDNCAHGAALMTGTSVEIELVASCKEMKVNTVLSHVFYEAMKTIPIPSYTEDEMEFARQITKSAELNNNGVYFTDLEPLESKPVLLSIGTDVADVSHTIPTILISAATMCKGTPLHHWSTTAQSGMSIGFKGMLYAAKCMASGSKYLLENPECIQKAWDEHKQTI